MARTVIIHGSDEVMAMYGIPGTFYRGKWERVKVTQISTDEDTPLEVRKSLVGLVIPTIFTKERIEEQTGATFPIPKESRLAYSPDVIEALKSAGRDEAAEQLRGVAPNPLDMYVLEKGIYELVQ
ncbi:MAG: hypothetical protein KKE50_03835 [Nanoarchaeota archaeon]|nr:hypothetical protein [Nanoarchaeota archaeon]